jgi:hypothetical protein
MMRQSYPQPEHSLFPLMRDMPGCVANTAVETYNDNLNEYGGRVVNFSVL